MTPEARKIRQALLSRTGMNRVDLMKGTPYQTPAYIFDSGTSGASVMIMGGTHGNEPAGYEAALRLFHRFHNNPPKSGKVIIVPLANHVAVDNYDRRVPVPDGVDKERGNLNRCYPGDSSGYPMERLAAQIQQLAIDNNVEVFIDLHEALRSHLKEDSESEKKALGQTIIYYPNEPSTWLLMNMLDQINPTIKDPSQRFSGLERPIKSSAAWWAGMYLECAAFTFETARKYDLSLRIQQHLQLTEIVLKEKGVI